MALKTIAKATWNTTEYEGTATADEVILTNSLDHPLEVISIPPEAVTTAVIDSSTAVYNKAGASSAVIVSWGRVTEGTLLTGSATDTTYNHSLVGSDSLVSNLGSTATRVVLLPGHSLRENGSTFATGTFIRFMYRHMVDIDIN